MSIRHIRRPDVERRRDFGSPREAIFATRTAVMEEIAPEDFPDLYAPSLDFSDARNSQYLGQVV